jgi:plastocyanin
MKKFSIFLLIMAMAMVVGGCGKKIVNQPEPIVQTPATENTTINDSAPSAPAPATTESSSTEPTTADSVVKNKNNNKANISISNLAFNPNNLTIKKGTTVTWVNDDQVPHAISGNAFSSESLNTGQSFSFTFNNTGTFSYICSIHPSMVGKIIVQ